MTEVICGGIVKALTRHAVMYFVGIVHPHTPHRGKVPPDPAIKTAIYGTGIARSVRFGDGAIG